MDPAGAQDEEVQLLDFDALIENVKYLMQLKEELTEKIHETDLKNETWEEILQCSTVTELEDVIADAPNVSDYFSHFPPLELPQLVKYITCTNILTAYELMGTKAQQSSETEILVTFVPPSNCENSSTGMLSLSKSGRNKYGLKHANVSTAVPVENLLEKFQDENVINRLPECLAWIDQYQQMFWLREKQFQDIKKCDSLEESLVLYANTSYTVVAFHVNLENNALEFVLLYRPQDMFPQEVNYSEINNKPISGNVAETLGEFTQLLRTQNIAEVLEESNHTMTVSEAKLQSDLSSSEPDEAVDFDNIFNI